MVNKQVTVSRFQSLEDRQNGRGGEVVGIAKTFLEFEKLVNSSPIGTVLGYTDLDGNRLNYS